MTTIEPLNQLEWSIRAHSGVDSGLGHNVLYSSHSHYILTVFWLFLLYTRSFVHLVRLGHHVNGSEDSANGDGMCQRLLQSRYSCSYSC